MAGTLRTQNSDVAAATVQRLHHDPWSFSFFQAVRLLERALPDRAPVGHFAHPNAEAVRFTQHASLSFPASEIQELKWAEGRAPILAANFIGLIGPSGVLPLHYTEFIVDRLRARDGTLFDFLNIFHHRLTSHFYRAWEKHRFAIGYERDRNDPLTSHLYDLAGIGMESVRNRHPFYDEVFAYYGGFFGMAARSSVSLEAILEDYFDVPVSVKQFVGVWQRLDECDQCGFEFEFSNSVELGGGAVVGDEVWDRQSRARIVLGPLSGSRYREFLPEGSAHASLRALTRMFSGDDIEYEVQLILKREYVAGCKLGADEEAGVRLGWFTWMKSQPGFDRDPGDTILLLA